MSQTEWLYFGTAVVASLAGLGLLFKSTHKRKEPDYPRPLDTFFEEGRCPNCGQGAGFFTYAQKDEQDILECPSCQSVYSVSYPPLALIKQVGGRTHKDVTDAATQDPRSAIR